MHDLPVAIVTPWFGEDLKGGAEQHAWQVATRLVARGIQVEVLTTCSRSFLEDWAQNVFPQGATQIAGITIRRFPVDPRNRAAFDSVNRQLLAHSNLMPGVSPIDRARENIWLNENINSAKLERYLQESAVRYKVFVFLPYLYGIVLRGLPLVADRAMLQPCLHDEAYAYLPAVASIIAAARRLLFLSQGEMELSSKLYGPSVLLKGIVLGAGVESDENAEISDLHPTAFGGRFVLCLGRRCKEKGTDGLINAFLAFRLRAQRSDLSLVLAGPGDHSYARAEHNIIDLGFVSEGHKRGLIANCIALCQPSTNESFSRVLFEAWRRGKPAVVHRSCLATASAIDVSGGGWAAETADEWVDALIFVDSASVVDLNAVGENGARYAHGVAEWSSVLDRYQQTFSQQPPAEAIGPVGASLSSIHQLLPNLSPGDAISNQALWIQKQLRLQGRASEIMVLHADESVRDQCKIYNPVLLSKDDGLIYHHSIGSETVDAAMLHAGKKWLVYHNITPAEFYEAYNKPHALLLRDGREQMWSLARSFQHAVGDSAYNADDLRLYGFTSPGVLPIAVDPDKWSVACDADIMKSLQDGHRNLLYVGRFAPNKCQHELIAAFARYIEIDPDSRLILIGRADPIDSYYIKVLETITFFGLQGRVLLPGHVSESELNSYYRTASLFWSMSEHEGFCVPIVEAMWFDVPILAFRAGAIPETLGDAGLMFDEKEDLDAVAIQASNLTCNPRFAAAILRRQQRRRPDFLPSVVAKKLAQALAL